MMHYQAKCGCKRISKSENIMETIIFWLCDPHNDINLKNNTANSLADYLAHDIYVSPYHIWL